MKTIDLLRKAYAGLRAIPNSRWITGKNLDHDGKCCGTGHLIYTLKLPNSQRCQIHHAVTRATGNHILEFNDFRCQNRCLYRTPKARVLFALRKTIQTRVLDESRKQKKTNSKTP